MTNQVDRFRAALTVLAGDGSVKDRLIRAYEDNLVEIDEEKLPTVVRRPFTELRRRMHSVKPLNGQGPICASVRKMSIREASECAQRLVGLFGELSRMQEDTQVALPLQDHGEARVPPFLVKTV